MIWFALLCLTVGSEYLMGVFLPSRPGMAILLFFIGCQFLGVSLWKALHVNELKKRFTLMLVNLVLILVSVASLQFLFFRLYFWLTPHFHAVPHLAPLLDVLLSAIGHETARQGEFIYLQTFKTVLPVSITFEKLGVPALCSFFLMSWMTLVWVRQKHWVRLILELGGIIGIFAIIRLIVLILLFVDGESLMLFWSPIWIGVSLLPLIPILAYFYPITRFENYLEGLKTSVTKYHLRHYGIMLICFLLIVVVLGTEDPGNPKSGQVLIDERHSNWEWTTIPFNKEHYGRKTTYNYYCFRTWLNHYYHVSVNLDKELTDELLRPYTTLIIKTPTTAFSGEELEAIELFVRGGGGLFLIGDHTNLYGMTTYINPVSEMFDVTFLPDDTFDLSTGAATVYQPPQFFAHPTVHHIQTFGFLTSCTLASPLFRSRSIMRGIRMGRENADYSHQNFFGNIKADINDEYGIFNQAVARKYGKGRVVAFSDSTVFSNFSMFLEGRPELTLGIMEFLNRMNKKTYKIVTVVLLLGAAFGLVLIHLQHQRNPLFLPISISLVSLILSGAIFIGNGVSTEINASNYREPQPHTDYIRICFDQSISRYRIPDLVESTPPDADFCFDAFYTSIQRLGYYPDLTPTVKILKDTSLLVFINPRGKLDDDVLSEVHEFLQKGGKVLVLENSDAHTYHTQQFQRLPQRSSETITIPTEFQTPSNFKIVKNKVGMGDLVIVFGAAEFSHLSMGATYSNPTDKQKLKYHLVYFLFQEVLQLPTQG